MQLYSKIRNLTVFALLLAVGLGAGCISVKKESKTPVLLDAKKATQAQLMNEVNRFASVSSMRAKMDLKFEDNSFAIFGSKEVYRQADGEVVVQRPGKILLKVQVPILHSDVAQMTSDGENFRVAVLINAENGKYRKFVKGTNNADYSKLQKSLSAADLGDNKEARKNVNAFANLRPQHFTDAMLVRPTDEKFVYTQSPIFQDEEDLKVPPKSPVRFVTRGYYLLDEFEKMPDGTLMILRRFWFDRASRDMRLARQQLFDSSGEIESDIIYGAPGNLGSGESYANLPLEITVTRPKEHYAMKLTYQTPDQVTIGNKFPDAAFTLQNSWNLEEVDLDQKLREQSAISPQPTPQNNAGANRFQQN